MCLNWEQGLSIEWQELLPIVVSCAMWHPACSPIHGIQFSRKGLSCPWGFKWDCFCLLLLSDAAFLGPCTPPQPDSLYHSTFTKDLLWEEVLTYASWGLSKNTNRAYSCEKNAFYNSAWWIASRSRTASKGTISLEWYVVAQLNSFLAAVCNLHITAGYGTLCRAIFFSTRFYAVFSTTKANSVFTVNLSHLRCSLQSWLSPRDFSIIWAAFNLVFLVFLRFSEFIYNSVRKFRPLFDLSTDGVAFYPTLACPLRIMVLHKLLKTDVYRQEQSLTIACTSSALCAESPMRKYFLLARPQ